MWTTACFGVTFLLATCVYAVSRRVKGGEGGRGHRGGNAVPQTRQSGLLAQLHS